VFYAYCQHKEKAIMSLKIVTSLALGTACLMTIATLLPSSAQAATHSRHGAADASTWSPFQNIRESERYDRLVATDPAFRRLRMRIECGPITDPVLYQQCIESFRREVQAWHDGQLQAFYGSSLAPQNYTSSSGR
jgi:hypothetical protein